jgi:hypothetical protein
VPEDEDAADEEAAPAAVPVPVVVADEAVPVPVDPPPVAQAFGGIVAAEYVCELAARAELHTLLEAFCNSGFELAMRQVFVDSSIDVRVNSDAEQALVSQRHLITLL